MYRNGVHTNTPKSVYDTEEERNSITKKNNKNLCIAMLSCFYQKLGIYENVDMCCFSPESHPFMSSHRDTFKFIYVCVSIRTNSIVFETTTTTIINSFVCYTSRWLLLLSYFVTNSHFFQFSFVKDAFGWLLLAFVRSSYK